MEDWITIEKEVVDQIPCVCGKGIQYKVRLFEVDSFSGEKKNQIFVKCECPNKSCPSNKKMCQ